MKYCSKCGHPLKDEAIICVSCGCQVADIHTGRYNRYQEEKSTLATCAMVFAFLSPIVGFILGVIGVTKYSDFEFKQRSKNAIIISIVVWLISVVLEALLYIL